MFFDKELNYYDCNIVFKGDALTNDGGGLWITYLVGENYWIFVGEIYLTSDVTTVGFFGEGGKKKTNK